MISSTPLINEFDPTIIPFQYRVLKHLRKDFNYSNGVNEMLLSGSVGSAKTVLGAHILATHALFNPGSQQLIVRRALKDLKSTAWRVLLDHYPTARLHWNKSEMKITLPNKSIIYGSSYDDGVYTRFRSYELSGAILEEGTESKDETLYNEILMRIGRLPHVKENYYCTITNPDSPAHYLHEKFIEKPTRNRSVFYSLTEQNPFLPKSYITQLKESLDPKMARRMLYGEWLEISEDIIYYNYNTQKNYRDYDYKYNPAYPLVQAHDFNIGLGKPMSSLIGQYIDGKFHVMKCFNIQGARTADILEEMYESGAYDGVNTVDLYGDASGKNQDTRSKGSDYDIILSFLKSKGLNVNYYVPRANPPIRRRHNSVNSRCENELGEINLFLYKGCEWLDKGLRLTQLKKGATILEDDSLPEQHGTTALGYWIDFVMHRQTGERSKTYQL